MAELKTEFKPEFAICILHLLNGKTYHIDFPEGTTIREICCGLLPYVAKDEDEEYEYLSDQCIFTNDTLGNNYAVVKIKAGGMFVVDKYEILGLEFI